MLLLYGDAVSVFCSPNQLHKMCVILYYRHGPQSNGYLPPRRTRFIFASGVTLCGWSAKHTTPLSVLARNQTKARALDVRRGRKWVRERESGVGQRNAEKSVGDGRGRRAVGSRHRTAEETSRHEIGSRAVREGQRGWVGIPSSFVEISLEIHASVSLQMHREMQGVTT